jgi:DNA-3-methyladenine glycosylase
MTAPKSVWLGPDFFGRDAKVVARALLGKALVTSHGNTVSSHTITETEAYVGPHDLASHSARGRTNRNAPMFGPPGTLYIYRIYGLHWMLNVVTGEVGYPAAVLIRSVEAITGPGRLTRDLGITDRLNGQMASRQAGLGFADRGNRIASRRILRTARIGVAYAGDIWAAKEYRFVLLPDAVLRGPRAKAAKG